MLAARRGHHHARAHGNAANLAGGDLAAPFQAAFADESEHLGASAHHRAHAGLAGRDDAAVWGQQPGVVQAQQLRVQLRLGRRHARLGRGFLGDVLVDLLGTQRPAALHGAGSVGIGRSFSGRGLGLGHGGPHYGHIGLHALGGKAGQQLPALDLIAHAGVQLGHAQATGFGANAGLLPGRDAAVGGQLDGKRAALGLGQ